MKIEEFIIRHIQKRLGEQKALLIYDPNGLYRDIVLAMAGDKVFVVNGSQSTISGREAALDAWCRLGQNGDEDLQLAEVENPAQGRIGSRDPDIDHGALRKTSSCASGGYFLVGRV